MKIKIFILFAVGITLFSFAHAASDRNNLFTCSTSELGTTCFAEKIEVKSFKYSQPIAFLIPNNSQKTNSISIHFHGHILGIERDKTPQAILNDFNFLKLLALAKDNSIMVVPFSTGKNVDFINELVPQFKEFTEWILNVLQIQNPTEIAWTLTGHSGAYKPYNLLLSDQRNLEFLKRLRRIFLFDATYGGSTFDTSVYIKFVQLNPKAEIFSVYRPEDPLKAGTELGSLKLKSDLNLDSSHVIKADIQQFPDAKDHWDVLKVYFPLIY